MSDDSIISTQSTGTRLTWSLLIKSLPVLLLLIFIRPLSGSTQQGECEGRHYNGADSIVCVCNATYCDDIPAVGNLEKQHAAVYISSRAGKRLHRSTVEFKESVHGSDVHKVRVSSGTRYQTVLGFGGSFTDAAGINIDSLGSETRRELLNAYFGTSGIQYTVGRVPIASCDFSTHEYSYADTPDDFELSNFSLAEEDFKYKIPNIKHALDLTNSELKLVASPWSAPAWMKTNNRMIGAGELRGSPDGPYHVTWANYYVKFLEAYYKEGIRYWGLTVQNEPLTGNDPLFRWQTMYFNATTERHFVRNHLGPALQANELGKKVSLMIMDDQREQLPHWSDEVLKDKDAAKYVSGMALHWYHDDRAPASLLSETHQHHPDKFILKTEACIESKPHLGNWTRAEQYAHDIIEDMSNWVVGWIDWNLCLDLGGGPNHAKNFVDSPVIVNATADEFYKQPKFYIMGHFSKFIRPGFIRIESKFDATDAGKIEQVAFVEPSSNQRVLVLLNQYDDTVALSIEDKATVGKALAVDLEPHSLATIVWNE